MLRHDMPDPVAPGSRGSFEFPRHLCNRAGCGYVRISAYNC